MSPHTDIAEAHAPSASVTLDIGAGRGALVIYPGERFRGREIEISRPAGDERRTHTGVHPRRTAAGSVLTAVFGSIPPGDYLVWPEVEGSAVPVTIREAAITEITLP
jgi:hypothetical protein